MYEGFLETEAKNTDMATIGKSPPIGNAERSHPNGDSLEERIQFLVYSI
jgi:hypothetical protein